MKKNRYLLGFFLLVAGALPTFSQVSNDNEDGVNKVDQRFAKDYVPGEVLLKLKDGRRANVRRAAGQMSAGITSLDAVLKEYGVKEMEQLLPNAKVKGSPRRAKAFNGSTVVERDLTQLYKVTLSEEKRHNTIQMVEQLKALPEVEFAEPNYKMYLMDTEIAGSFGGNPYATQQWYLDDYGVKQLWNKPIVNPTRPVIAIIDTGVDLTHPDLKDNLWTNQAEADGEANYDNDGNGFKGDVHGWDFINNTPNVKDFNMHGTHVAGIAAAANNGIGIIGANPKALIMAVSVMQSDGTGDVATIIKGINYAIANGATVLNLSLGTYANSSALRQALANAYQSAVIVAAAGNDGLAIEPQCGILWGPMFPAAYSFVLGVQATQSNGNLALFSNYDCSGPNYSSTSSLQDPDGFNYELKAPGTNMLSTIPGGKYKALNGTSMAAPLVAGAISALKMVKQYDTQEILWGDLLHTDNIAQAYAVTARPAELDLMKIMYRERKELTEESEEDYSGDGRIDAGETISLYPVIRTTFGEASNIKMKLEMGDEFEDPYTVQIITDGWVDFGMHLDAYGKGVSINPMKLKVADNVANGRHIKMKFTAKCDEANTQYVGIFTMVVDNIRKISGMITENMILTADHEWLVSSSVAIPVGITLTIEPGTTIRFNDNTGISNSGTLVADGTPEAPILMIPNETGYWNGVRGTTLRYCKLQNVKSDWNTRSVSYENCVLDNFNGESYLLDRHDLIKVNLINSYSRTGWLGDNKNVKKYSNFVNNDAAGRDYPQHIPSSLDPSNNWVNSYAEGRYMLGKQSAAATIIKLDEMAYYGTSSEEILRPYIYEMGNSSYTKEETYAWFDLTNMKKEPVSEAHGIVWKVVVNGKDAQDEYDQLSPLGVGKHKFEVYFNRPMNKAVAPQISFGVREPYTQNAVTEEGNWNEEGTIYTAYKTITGKTKSDGVNRIYVYGAEDNEFFECPYEKTRFNINIQAAGSMATGFAAEAGMGRVNLTWDNTNNNFEDAMGFNIYRYTLDSEGNVQNNTRINADIVDIETTAYTDYDVTPGTTYYYMYKVLSTDLQEYDASNVVAVTPLTATRGDANGDSEVDVQDVITTVNYAAGMDPKPFIFEAADMNTDESIDILDVVGIIQKILNPSSAPAMAMVENTAIYTIEDGVLYVESPVALAGVQVQLNMSEKKDITVLEDLNGFEHTSAWLSDNDYLFLAYNLNGKTLSAGKHALLNIGDAEISSLRLSNAMGGNVTVEGGEGTTRIDTMGSKIQLQGGVFNLKGQKVAADASDLKKLPKGVYIVNGKKVIK